MNWFRRRQARGSSPYVTGILATCRRDRHPFAQLAIDSFLAQDWPHLQVLVYNATSVPLRRDRRVRELRLRALPWHDMWNTCLHNADGTYCTLLYDDCHYAPQFLSVMLANAMPERLHLLQYKEAYSLTAKTSRLVEDDRLFCPAWRRLHPARFTDNPAEFTARFYDLKRIEATASMVTRFVQ